MSGDLKRISTWKEEERHFILECLRLYKNLPALWKVKSEEYTDKQKKNDSYDILVEKYRERFPDATREDVKKKINVLRTNFRKELRKTEDSKLFAAKPEDIYVSNLWYFDDLYFLKDLETMSKTSTSSTELGKIHDETGDEGAENRFVAFVSTI